MRIGKMKIEIPEGEIKQIMDELDLAQETIYRCYHKLLDLGVVTIRETALEVGTQERPVD